jgi:hypothetical protein
VLAGKKVSDHRLVALGTTAPFNASGKMNRFFLASGLLMMRENLGWLVPPIEIKVVVEAFKNDAVELLGILLFSTAPMTCKASTKLLGYC